MTEVPEPRVPVPTPITPDVSGAILLDPSLCLQAVKVLRTAEFVPYVVFIEAPDFETLRAMNRAALESGVSTKQLTVRGSEGQWEGSGGCLGWEGPGQS